MQILTKIYATIELSIYIVYNMSHVIIEFCSVEIYPVFVAWVVYIYPVYIYIRVCQRTWTVLKIVDQSTYEGRRGARLLLSSR